MADPFAATGEKQFFGHPRGLSTLFFTEMWERFGYYGMRGLLLLFMTAEAVNGGLGMETPHAASIYGLFTFGAYALALPGGWIADRMIGQRLAVLYGGVIIAAGYFCLAVPSLWTFYFGLCLVVIGTGLLKPNVSAIVGDLYPEGGARRDAGFSIFYMGINIGAILGPTICSLLGEGIDWHLGFLAAAIGMTLGCVQYVVGWGNLQGAGELREEAADPAMRSAAFGSFIKGIGVAIVTTVAIVLLSRAGIVPITLLGFAQATGVIVVLVAVAYFAYVIFFACRDAVERKRVLMIAILFFGAAMFWSGFEQAGSSMNLFARDFTDRVIGGWEMPASMLQNINAIFIVIFAPIVGSLWVWLQSRNPSMLVKFGMGLGLLGVGFMVLAWGSTFVDVANGVLVTPAWLIVTYFFHTIGELCLSPVGLSSITKLSPDRLVGQMMGTWFMGTALGNLIAGLAAGYIGSMPVSQLFATVGGVVIGTGLVFLLFAPALKKLAVGIE